MAIARAIYWIHVPERTNLLRWLITSPIIPWYEVDSRPWVDSYCNGWSRLWYVFVLLELQEGGWWFWRDESKCGGLLTVYGHFD
jgi:hypothetical protein